MRSLVALLAALSLGAGLAACGGEAQTRDGNPDVEDQRLDERNPPPDATGDEAEPNGEE